MATNNGAEKPNENGKGMGFEFIDENEIESVKRGRKAILIPEMIAFFQKAKVGQTVRVPTMTIDQNKTEAEKKKEKAKFSSTMKNQAKQAGWQKTMVTWDVYGVPNVKRLG